ncbi:putative methyltransferase NSUN7 isoform X2 [Nothobranchius furzeri]|uniref:putative methyltransferase NSUN7 isoform X2 n=1 Tax=Nothobranchius furzeri TaxID=105023 RepID=UPI003904AFAF
MVEKKNVGRLLNLTFNKSIKVKPQTTTSHDLTLLLDQGDRDLWFSHLSKEGFPDRVYLLAAAIFQNQHLEKPAAHRFINYGKDRGLPLPEFRDEDMQRAAYELAFSTLKYQELLEEVLIDSRFCRKQPVDRKFPKRKRQRKGEIIEAVREVENVLLRFKTKLAAALARCRLRHNHSCIECFLPETVRKKQEMALKLPLYAWVNTLKSSLDEVQSVLRNAGFSQVKSIEQLKGHTFCQDPHCGDTLVFPAQLKAQLYFSKLLCDHKLIAQDKSCCLGPNAACSLLPEEGDVLMVGCFSGLTVFHVASLISQKHKADSKNQPVVYVCVNDCTEAQREKLRHTVSIMGCKNVKLMQEDFQSLDRGDKRLQKVRVILLIPRCSVSAVSNPVEFILQENGDTDLLQDLSRGPIAQSKLESLVAQQKKDIDHALNLPIRLAVVYSTCSSYPEENADVLNTALQKARDCPRQKGKPKLTNFRPIPPPFSSPDHGEAAEETEPFFMLEPTEFSNGCFLAVVDRKPDPAIQEAPRDLIARANAKGLFDGIGVNQKKHHEDAGGAKTTAQALCSQAHVSACTRSRKRQAKGSIRHQELQQPSQGKLQVPCSIFHSKQECPPTPSSSFKPHKSRPAKFPTKTSSTLRSAVPPSSPAAPVVRPRRTRADAQKPVVLVLPVLNFPGSFQPQHSCRGSFPGRWKAPQHHL